MRLGTTYICVGDMRKSLDFYKSFLQQEPVFCNEDRWVSFECGISLYNKKYDVELINRGEVNHFNQVYLDEFDKDDYPRKNNLVIFNFMVDDLAAEYERMKKLSIGQVSEIFYVNVHMPYYYFNIVDPDGNILEITGNYEAAPGNKKATENSTGI